MGKRIVLRQGDVILQRLDDSDIDNYTWYIEQGLYKTQFEIVGETGHKHVFVGKYKVISDQILIAEENVKLIHDQHPTLEIPRGIYVITRVRDYLMDRFSLRYGD